MRRDFSSMREFTQAVAYKKNWLRFLPTKNAGCLGVQNKNEYQYRVLVVYKYQVLVQHKKYIFQYQYWYQYYRYYM